MVSFAARIALTLPPWWGSAHPNLDTLVAALAAGSAAVDAQTKQLIPFLRIAGTTGHMLDIAAYDYYGTTLTRLTGETDDDLRQRIRTELFAPRGTRSVFEQRLEAVSGAPVIVIDTRRTADTGYLGNANLVPTLFYNSLRRDCYTNVKMQYQWFVRLQNVSHQLSNADLALYAASLMPAGTVSWIRIT